MISHREPLDRSHLGALLLHSLVEAPLGRRTLVERTGLTESVVRTELNKLEAAGLVRYAKAGTLLTESARERYLPALRALRIAHGLDLGNLELDRSSSVALIPARPGTELSSWQCRDLAVREGATGTLVLKRGPRVLEMADCEGRFAEQNPDEASRIEAAVGPLNPGDWVMVVFAASLGAANAGLWRVLTAVTPGLPGA